MQKGNGRMLSALEPSLLCCRFDSGSSWAGVLSREGLSLPADLYLEGSDQHRGERTHHLSPKEA